MERRGLTPTAFSWAAGEAQEEHILLLLNASTAGLDCCWIYIRVWLCLFVCGLRM